MRAGNREYLQLFACSAALTALIAVAPVLALFHPGGLLSLEAAQSRLVQIERAVSYALFAVLLLLVLWRMRSRPSESAAVDTPANQSGAQASLRPVWDDLLRYIAVSLPALPLLVYLWQYNQLAYASLFLGDQDFTNISAALNATARGEGVLVTPYLSTGPAGSYLGHHFSPILLLYVPAYWLVQLFADSPLDRPTHFIYAVLLWSTLALGLGLWARLFQKEIRSTTGAVLLMALLCAAYPLWRLALSFHYELPVLPLSALFFLALRQRRSEKGIRASFWFYASLLLWLAVKEDIGLYLILFGLYLCAHRGEGSRSSTTLHLARGLTVITVAVAWTTLAIWSLDAIGGSERVDWVATWREPGVPVDHSLRPSLLLLLATGGLALLSLRLFAIVLLPILIFHFVSEQIWHHNYLGHYSYAILPFLLFAAMRGWQRIEAMGSILYTAAQARQARFAGLTAAVFVMACSLAASAADRYMPLPAPPEDPDRQALLRFMQIPAADDCVQTQWHFSAHAPLSVRVYPMIAPENNPARDLLPGPNNFSEFYFRPNAVGAKPCAGTYYLLMDRTRALPPVHTQAQLDAFADFARMNLERVDLDLESENGEASSLEMYRLLLD